MAVHWGKNLTPTAPTLPSLSHPRSNYPKQTSRQTNLRKIPSAHATKSARARAHVQRHIRVRAPNLPEVRMESDKPVPVPVPVTESDTSSTYFRRPANAAARFPICDEPTAGMHSLMRIPKRPKTSKATFPPCCPRRCAANSVTWWERMGG